jgi:ADP-ribose pyrophosphatase YjhB (NUDIX family)
MKQRFFYCPRCGGGLSYKGDGERPRLTCGECGYIFYENPVAGVAAVVLDHGGKVLLGRRRGSYRGRWCIPCGYVEYDEDVYAAAVREFREETGLEIKITGICAVKSNFHNPDAHTVGIWFWAGVTGGELRPGGDLDRLGFFHPDDLPPLAFPTDLAVIGEIKHLRTE